MSRRGCGVWAAWLFVLLPNAATWSRAEDNAARDPQWSAQREQVLALGRLTEPPKMHTAEGFAEQNGSEAIYFDGLPWRGKPTRVFARLGRHPRARPGAEGRKSPAVVLVHGGGGSAFSEWVQKWNEHGFVAISIAVEGQTDRRESPGPSWQRHDGPGPARIGIYGDSDAPLADQWMYHAVADTILANSLVRSLPEVDPEHVGVMGISWGGVITSTVIGIDSRFAFAIPTYGCGGLADSENQYGRALGSNILYREVWDPLVRMRDVRMPVMWLSWTEDLAFPLDAQRRCYAAAPGPHVVALLPGMRHSHMAGWGPPDSYAFAESVVQTGAPWCRQLGVEAEGGTARVRFESRQPIDKATLVATSDTGFTGRRTWTAKPVELQQVEERVVVDVTPPAGTTAWFVSLHSGRLVVSSDLQEVGPR